MGKTMNKNGNANATESVDRQYRYDRTNHLLRKKFRQYLLPTMITWQLCPSWDLPYSTQSVMVWP